MAMSRGPRRLLLRLLALALGVVAGAAAVEPWLAARVHSPEEARFAHVLDASQPIRDVVFGPSHAMCGIDPRRLTGPPVTNLGIEGAGPAYLRRWYAFFRRHQGPPRRAIVVAAWFMFRREALPRTFEHDAMYPSTVTRSMILGCLCGQR